MENKMNDLNVELLDKATAVVNLGDIGGYVQVEQITSKHVLITVFNRSGDVLSEQEHFLG
jgi:hypothetical protein